VCSVRGTCDKLPLRRRCGGQRWPRVPRSTRSIRTVSFISLLDRLLVLIHNDQSRSSFPALPLGARSVSAGQVGLDFPLMSSKRCPRELPAGESREFCPGAAPVAPGSNVRGYRALENQPTFQRTWTTCLHDTARTPGRFRSSDDSIVVLPCGGRDHGGAEAPRLPQAGLAIYQ
jgi:hypothetical protein